MRGQIREFKNPAKMIIIIALRRNNIACPEGAPNRENSRILSFVKSPKLRISEN